jgi:DNA polymerase-1
LVFVGHSLRSGLFCLRKLDLPWPRKVWDLEVAERAFALGKNHPRYRTGPTADVAERARADEEADAEDEFNGSLNTLCLKHGVPHPLGGDENRVRASFLDHPDGAVFTDEQVRFVAGEAEAAARLYLPQFQAAALNNTLDHLVTVEMPFVLTAAEVAWIGARYDRDKCRVVAETSRRHLAVLEAKLRAFGLENHRSDHEVESLMRRLGLLDLFKKDGGYSFDRHQLSLFLDRHEAIRLLHAARRVSDLLGQKVLTGELEGSDGRVHPRYRQLGAHTGRLTSRNPNIMGLGRVFRPLVVPEDGFGIGEVDLSQIEVGVAAAVYGDGNLVGLFNTCDVYSAMAQEFYKGTLSGEDVALDSLTFKEKHPGLRERMKSCTLGIIYGLTSHGLSPRLNIGIGEAEKLMEGFLRMFPSLERARREAEYLWSVRGYAEAVSGLRRHRLDRRGKLTFWEKNWLVNFPVQGSAAVVFKAAGNRLFRLYTRYGARLIIPVYDAFVFEAPLKELGKVAELTRRVMVETVEEYFPQLRPRAEVNIKHPGCWNKEGHFDSVERWLEDPTYRF